MRLYPFFLVETVFISLFARPVSVNGTWSVIGVDRATGQVGGAGATCRLTGSGSLLEGDRSDYRSVPGIGCLVGQDMADSDDADDAKHLMECGGGATEIVNKYGGRSDQWAAVLLNGDKDVNTRSDCTKIAKDATGEVKRDFSYSVQGNRLSHKDVIENAKKEFKKGGKGKGGGPRSRDFEKCDDLADRLMRAVEAGAQNGQGDARCTGSGLYSADTAYLKVEEADGTVLIECDITTVPGQNAIETLRKDYESQRGPCKKHPGPHHPLHRSLHPFLGVATLAILGFIVKRKTHTSVVEKDESIDTSLDKNGPVIVTQLQTPYVRNILVQPR